MRDGELREKIAAEICDFQTNTKDSLEAADAIMELVSRDVALCDQLAEALELTDARLQAALKGTPIRDADEVITGNAAALAAYRERRGPRDAD